LTIDKRVFVKRRLRNWANRTESITGNGDCDVGGRNAENCRSIGSDIILFSRSGKEVVSLRGTLDLLLLKYITVGAQHRIFEIVTTL
jgi:hypothetical protein